MLFQNTWQWIILQSPYTGQPKTQTRRLAKQGDGYLLSTHNMRWRCVKRGGRILYEVGKTYAIQSSSIGGGLWTDGKGHFVSPISWAWRTDDEGEWYSYHYDKRIDYISRGYEPARIRITDIRREDVRTIANDDLRAEGFSDYKGFMLAWCLKHDKTAYHKMSAQEVWYGKQYFDERPRQYYQAWALEFELVGR